MRSEKRAHRFRDRGTIPPACLTSWSRAGVHNACGRLASADRLDRPATRTCRAHARFGRAVVSPSRFQDRRTIFELVRCRSHGRPFSRAYSAAGPAVAVAERSHPLAIADADASVRPRRMPSFDAWPICRALPAGDGDVRVCRIPDLTGPIEAEVPRARA